MILAHHEAGKSLQELGNFCRAEVLACRREDVAMVRSETDRRHGDAVFPCCRKDVVSCEDFCLLAIKYSAPICRRYLYVVVRFANAVARSQKFALQRNHLKVF